MAGDPGGPRRRAAPPPQLARRQEARDRLRHGIRAIEREEMPTGIDDLDRALTKLLFERLGPAWLEEFVVCAPEDQCRRLDFVDVLRAAGEGPGVARPPPAELRTTATQVLERPCPLVDELIGDSSGRDHPGFEAFAESSAKVDVDHDLVPRRLL